MVSFRPQGEISNGTVCGAKSLSYARDDRFRRHCKPKENLLHTATSKAIPPCALWEGQ